MSIRANIDRRYRKSRNKRVKRPKSFRSEEAAHTYAKANGITNYSLKNLRSSESATKKIRIVQIPA
jgi:hypothetical protein